MFDFQETLDTADNYAKKGNKALACFHYWLIGFAYNDEEFPYFYTESIGEKGRKGFFKYVKKNPALILTAESYIKFKEQLSIFPTYMKYFKNFERVVGSFIKKNQAIILMMIPG